MASRIHGFVLFSFILWSCGCLAADGGESGLTKAQFESILGSCARGNLLKAEKKTGFFTVAATTQAHLHQRQFFMTRDLLRHMPADANLCCVPKEKAPLPFTIALMLHGHTSKNLPLLTGVLQHYYGAENDQEALKETPAAFGWADVFDARELDVAPISKVFSRFIAWYLSEKAAPYRSFFQEDQTRRAIAFRTADVVAHFLNVAKDTAATAQKMVRYGLFGHQMDPQNRAMINNIAVCYQLCGKISEECVYRKKLAALGGMDRHGGAFKTNEVSTVLGGYLTLGEQEKKNLSNAQLLSCSREAMVGLNRSDALYFSTALKIARLTDDPAECLTYLGDVIELFPTMSAEDIEKNYGKDFQQIFRIDCANRPHLRKTIKILEGKLEARLIELAEDELELALNIVTQFPTLVRAQNIISSRCSAKSGLPTNIPFSVFHTGEGAGGFFDALIAAGRGQGAMNDLTVKAYKAVESGTTRDQQRVHKDLKKAGFQPGDGALDLVADKINANEVADLNRRIEAYRKEKALQKQAAATLVAVRAPAGGSKRKGAAHMREALDVSGKAVAAPLKSTGNAGIDHKMLQQEAEIAVRAMGLDELDAVCRSYQAVFRQAEGVRIKVYLKTPGSDEDDDGGRDLPASQWTFHSEHGFNADNLSEDQKIYAVAICYQRMRLMRPMHESRRS